MAEILEVKKNFNWEDITCPLMIFMPCYGNKKLVEYSVRHIKNVSMGRYAFSVVIGNDGKHIDWSYLNTDNMRVHYFTLLHNSNQPRNGAFIRNYALNHCRTKYFLQKDGEIVIEGDFPVHAVEVCKRGNLWRPGNVYVLDENNSIKYMEQESMVNLEFAVQKRIEPVKPIDVLSVKKHIIAMDGDINFTSFFHYAYCAKTEDLHGIHGYDEDYKFYGFEDTDMFCRLTAIGKVFEVDYTSSVVHLWHPSTVNRQQLPQMGNLFKKKNPSTSVRNETGWGAGV